MKDIANKRGPTILGTVKPIESFNQTIWDPAANLYILFSYYRLFRLGPNTYRQLVAVCVVYWFLRSSFWKHKRGYTAMIPSIGSELPLSGKCVWLHTINGRLTIPRAGAIEVHDKS